MSEQNYWVPPLSKKQMELFNMGIEADSAHVHPNTPSAILVSGARYTGKTVGTLHRICRHLWDTKGARVALFSKTIKNLTAGGVFRDLTDLVIPVWIESGIGFRYTTEDSEGIPGPKTDAKTRVIYFKVTNRWGGESELMLFSLDHDHEVHAKLRGTRFSMIWFSEFSLFHSASIFRTCMMQLRMPHLKDWEHMFIADTNPAEEGEDHWEYKLWYERKLEGEDATVDEYNKSLRLIEFFLEDNPWLTAGKIASIKSMYRDDPGEYAREVEGRWVKGHGNKGKHFADVYFPHIHVVGGDEEAGDQIDLLPTSDVLITGWDLGASVNHAAVILEKRMSLIVDKEFSVWCALDELVSVNEQMQLPEYTELFMRKMDELEEKYNRKFDWFHYSDDSSLNVFRNTGAGTDALEVELASQGRIKLIGVNKPEGSVRNRVRIVRRLLRENRLFISSRCKALQAMLSELKQGTTQKDFVAWNEHKHPFDALTYPILVESAHELIESVFRPTSTGGGKNYVSI